MRPILEYLEKQNLDIILIDILKNLGQKGNEISPKGLLSYLTILHDRMNFGSVNLRRKLYNQVSF